MTIKVEESADAVEEQTGAQDEAAEALDRSDDEEGGDVDDCDEEAEGDSDDEADPWDDCDYDAGAENLLLQAEVSRLEADRDFWVRHSQDGWESSRLWRESCETWRGLYSNASERGERWLRELIRAESIGWAKVLRFALVAFSGVGVGYVAALVHMALRR